MSTKEKLGHTPTSLKGLLLYKDLYKKDLAEFGRLFFTGLPFKRVSWRYNIYGKVQGEVTERRTEAERERLCRQVCKRFPKVFTPWAQEYYLSKKQLKLF